VEHRYRAPVPALSGPPSAPRRPSSRVLHGVEVVDDFAWMRQTDDPDLITYLRAETAWCDAATARLQGLFGQISAELAAAMPDEFPALRAVFRYFAECDPDEQFEFGLDLLIRGMEAKVRPDR
jgi:oligopeptidase B